MKTKSSFLLVLLALFPAHCVLGQSPKGFNYQAIARDGSNNPITTAIDARFSIQSDSLGGTVFWVEEHSGIIPNEAGMFTSVIGKGARKSGLSKFSDIDWTVSPKYIKTEINYGGWKMLGSSKIWSVPYALVADSLGGPVGKLTVKGTTSNMEESLFEVRNTAGKVVFAVYNEGVRVYVGDGNAKGSKGGFAVSSMAGAKAGDPNFLFVSRDSIRAYVYDDPLNKAVKGGFAVSGYNNTKKQTTDYLLISPDSARIYIDDRASTKGAKGGFSVSGFTGVKGEKQNLLTINNDSVRIYIDDQTKGVKGGFAVGGFTNAKGNKNFLNIETGGTGIIDPAENRILWYPLKNAFLTGQILIEDPADVGENSFMTGFESKASGMYSQAMGYMNVASGQSSTAMGRTNIAEGENSLVIGTNSYASGKSAAAVGEYCTASGGSSMAIGYMTIASGGASFAAGSHSNATNANSTALGWGSTASGETSTAIGSAAVASGKSSFAFGNDTRASKENSFSFGKGSRANGISSYAFGDGVIAGSETNSNCYAFGKSSSATGSGSYAFGDGAVSSGLRSYAFGSFGQDEFTFPLGTNTLATGNNTFAAGQGAVASGDNAISIGFCTKADAQLAIAFGYGSKSYGNRSPISIGEYCVSTGVASISMGFWSVAQGRSSLAIGNTAIATGNEGIALGYHTTAAGGQSFATGAGTSANYYGSAAFGENSVSDASFATAMGQGSHAKAFASLVIGRYNAATGSDSWVDTDPAFAIGNGTWDGARSNSLTILKNGNIGIGYATPVSALHIERFITGHLVYMRNGVNNSSGKGIAILAGQDGVNSGAELITFFSPNQTYLGTITQSGSGSVAYNTTSDARMKENIVNTSVSLNDLMKIQVRDFNYINDIQKVKLTGFVAQELFEVYPDAVTKPNNEEDVWGVDYGKITPLIVKAVQDQEEMISALKEENRLLKASNEDLQKRLERVEQLVLNDK